MSSDTDRIRVLNDELRQHLLGGGAVMTPAVAALGPDAVKRLVQTIATFDDFCTANDPHGEHVWFVRLARPSCSRSIITTTT
jgi:hypothetical protein